MRWLLYLQCGRVRYYTIIDTTIAFIGYYGNLLSENMFNLVCNIKTSIILKAALESIANEQIFWYKRGNTWTQQYCIQIIDCYRKRMFAKNEFVIFIRKQSIKLCNRIVDLSWQIVDTLIIIRTIKRRIRVFFKLMFHVNFTPNRLCKPVTIYSIPYLGKLRLTFETFG